MATRYKEPPIDKASSKAIVETIVGERNADLQGGNWIVTKARVISGNYNRLFILGEHLNSLGVDVEKDLIMIAASSIGFSKELPDFGMRGEAIQIITQQNLPKKETVTSTTAGIIRRAQPTTETSE